MAPGLVNVIYPVNEGATFDLDYYLKTHMPLVHKRWGPLGLQSWTVSQLNPDAGYQICALLHWDSSDSIQKALADPSAGEIMGDIKNFTNTQPVIVGGAQVASS